MINQALIVPILMIEQCQAGTDDSRWSVDVCLDDICFKNVLPPEQSG
ncbi:hypothetical protein [Pollutimonas nitritireducens]|nr:hypothetical protein [Pollutimonas nitritireducens]